MISCIICTIKDLSEKYPIYSINQKKTIIFILLPLNMRQLSLTKSKDWKRKCNSSISELRIMSNALLIFSVCSIDKASSHFCPR